MQIRTGMLAALAATIGLWAANALAQAGPPQVTVAKPLASRVAQWDEFIGRFEATERVEVRPRVSGYIDQVHFRDGSIVNHHPCRFRPTASIPSGPGDPRARRRPIYLEDTRPE